MTPDELQDLEPGAKEFYASSKHLKGFDLAKFVGMWTQLITSGTGVIFAMRDDEGQVQGAISGVIYPEPYSEGLVATEFFWFVRPQHRGKGLDLYYRLEQWAKEKQASQIRMAHLCDLMPDGLKWLYGELGFEPIEILYAKDLP